MMSPCNVGFTLGQRVHFYWARVIKEAENMTGLGKEGSGAE